MDANKIDRLHEAHATFSGRLGVPSSNVETNDLNVKVQEEIVNNYGPNKPLDGHIKLSECYEQVKTKRSQGRNQVANSLKLYDRRTKVYCSIALIGNIVVDDKAPEFSDDVKLANLDKLITLQSLFDEFLLSIHEKL